ncbi:MAG: hypothetical protein JWQ39_2489 [Glaciihabitans sp.]|nr:hypothetical protein [Glaciihabitans sp.]
MTGKAHRLPVNRRATALWWLLQPETSGNDTIVGDVVVVGSLGRNFATDVPADFTQLVMKTRRFKVQVGVTARTSSWLDLEEHFTDYFEAAIHAVKVMELFARPVRVQPT